MKKYKILLLSTIVAFAFYSCDDYLDINTSPNAPSVSNVTPDLMLAAALSQPYSQLVRDDETPRSNYFNDANELGNIFMNSWAGDVNNITGVYQEEFTLTMTTTFHSAIWDRLYREMGTLQTIINNNDTEYSNIKAIAMVMKSFHFQTLVDLYGDIPYSQAHQLGDSTTPAYDNDEDIYRDLIVQLDNAIALIDNSTSSLNPGVNDVIFGGNMDMWKRFANTVKLRILLREATKAETNATTATYLTTQFAALNADFITSDVTLNPGYTAVSGRQNPFWANFGFTSGGNTTFDNGLVRASDYFAKFLDGTTTGVVDSRLERLFSPLSGLGVVGVVQGADNTTAPSDLSKIGPGLLVSAAQDSYIMTASESYFLQAEAMNRGYLAGTGETEFNSGIAASFTLLGASQAGYTNDGINLIGWAGSPNKIEAIMTQKWIALAGINGIQSWIDYTRTGYPAVPLALTAQQTAKPNRLLYPASEYSANSANVPAQSAPDAFSTHVFWDEN